jgi:signal peptidase I
VKTFRVAGLSVFGVVVIAGAGLALFAVDFPRVMNNDMAPSLRKGDLLLACRICGTPQRGDVVLFVPPDKPSELQVRRVVAVPGDSIAVKKGAILIDGNPPESEKLDQLELSDVDADDTAPRKFNAHIEALGKHRYRVIEDRLAAAGGERASETLETNRYFLAADRRTLTKDSREWGTIPRSSIRSIVMRVLSAGDKDPGRQTRVP